MARSSELARLTEAHRVAQIAMGTGVTRDLARAWRSLSPFDLDGTFPRYAAEASAIVQARRAGSSILSARYFSAARAAQGATGAAATLAARAPTAQLLTSLQVTGPITAKRAISQGATAPEAMSRAFSASAGAAKRHTLNGGRETIMAATRRDRVFWARITDGKACPFCAMLASRGPVYSANTADFDSHDRCGCSAEPFYGDPSDRSLWHPTSRAYREIWDTQASGIPGKGSLGAFRKALADPKTVTPPSLLPPPTGAPVAPSAAPAAPAPAPVPAYRAEWDSARAKLPDDGADFGKVDGEFDLVGKNDAPGATALAHLDAVQEAGGILRRELDDRVAARIAREGADKVEDSAEILALRAQVAKAEDEVRDLMDARAARAIEIEEDYFARNYPGRTAADLTDLEAKRFTTWTNALKGGDTEWIRISRLKEAKAKVLAGLREDLNGLSDSLSVGTPGYARILREETLRLMEEIRPHGGSVPIRAGAPADAITAMEQAFDVYPTAWLDKFRSAIGDHGITVKVVGRGYNSGGSVIALSQKAVKLRGGGKMDDVAIHEIGHSMELFVPGLSAAERTYLWKRTMVVQKNGTAKLPGKRSIYGGTKEVYRPSAENPWRATYTGKDYGQKYTPEDQRSWEVFTTGVESVYGGSSYFHAESWRSFIDAGSKAAPDNDFRDFMLGVLSAL